MSNRNITIMKFNIFLRKFLKILRIAKRYMGFNFNNIGNKVLRFSNVITKNISLEFFEKLLDIILKLIDFMFTKLLICLITSICMTLPVYYMFPALFTFSLEFFCMDLSELSVHEKLVNKDIRIFSLEKQLLDIQEQNILKDIKLQKTCSERDGLIEVIQKVQQEKNWWTIIGTVVGVTLAGGLVCYFCLSTDNADFFRIILNSVGDGNQVLTRLVTQSSEQLNTNIVTTADQLTLIETTLALLNNAVSSIIKDIETLLKK
jgi:hypothetical protein